MGLGLGVEAPRGGHRVSSANKGRERSGRFQLGQKGRGGCGFLLDLATAGQARQGPSE